MDKQELLNAKASTLEQEVALWAQQNTILVAGEQIRLTLEIQTVPTVVAKIKQNNERSQYYRFSEDLTEEDWKTIMDQLAKSAHLPAIQFLREHNGQKIKFDKINEMVRSRFDNNPEYFFNSETVNAIFRRIGSKYRVRRLTRGPTEHIMVKLVD